jgi:hypothetical protein
VVTTAERVDRAGARHAGAHPTRKPTAPTITVKPDSTVTCEFGGAGGQASRTVTFTVSDASGGVDRDQPTAMTDRED